VEIFEQVNGLVPAPVEGYKKDDTPHFCAQRLKALVESHTLPADKPEGRQKPVAQRPYTFETVTGGTVTFDHAVCATCKSKVCVKECVAQILALNEEGCPVLNITPEEAKGGRCIECLACDVACYFQGAGGGYVELPIQGLEAYRRQRQD
jgi:ferredoxin-like protein FixX